MADLTSNKQPDKQTPENGELEKSLESLSLDELLASVKDDLARVDAMMSWGERRSRRSSLPICPRCLN